MTKLLKGALPRFLISGAAIAVIVFSLRGSLLESFHILRHDVRYEWFIAGMTCYLAVQLLMAFRLNQLFRIHGVILSYFETFYLCLLGLFFNLFLPSAVGGDVARIYYAYKHSGKKIGATTSVITDRLVGFLSIMLIASVALVLQQGQMQNPRVSYVVYAFIAIVLGTMTVFLSQRVALRFKWLHVFIPSKKIKARISEIYYAINSCKNHKGTLGLCLGVSLLGQGLVVILYYLLALSLGVKISPLVFFILIPLVTIVSMAPSIGGLGVREAGAIYFFSAYMEPERALAMSLLADAIIYGFGLIFGIIYALCGGLKSKSIHDMEEVAEGSS